MLERIRIISATSLGFSLVSLVACGDSGGSGPGDATAGSGVGGDAVGTTGTTGGGAGASTTSSGGSGTGVGAGPGGGTGGSGTDGPGGSTGGASTDGPGAGAGGESTGEPGGGGGGSGAGGSGAGGSGELDCSTDPCSAGEVCVPNAGCGATLGRCLEANEAVCPSGAVCGCDGVIYDNQCDAYAAHVGIDVLSDCAQPDGTIACFDRFCEASTESCRIVNESRCDQGCLPLCPGMRTLTYAVCIPALPNCDAPVCDCLSCLSAGQCSEDDDGITLTCVAGCVG